MNLVKVDKHRRLTLPKTIKATNRMYNAHIGDNGTIILTPVVVHHADVLKSD